MSEETVIVQPKPNPVAPVIAKDDWKAKSGTAAVSVMGLAGLILHYVDPTNEYAMSVKVAIGLILSGFAGFGFADKLQKLIAKL